jgi:RimJ/RimL family protein N-acetyltransferase
MGSGARLGGPRGVPPVEVTRPLFARVAEHNVGSAKVLTRAGFVQVGSETSYAAGVGREVVEHIYRVSEEFLD